MKALQIKNFPNYYITDTGDVYTRNYRRSGRIKKLKLYEDRYGYYLCEIYDKAKKKVCLVHRLVAEAFIPNYDDKLEINHKNGIKTDNRVENLEWVTHSENNLHKFRVLGYRHPFWKKNT